MKEKIRLLVFILFVVATANTVTFGQQKRGSRQILYVGTFTARGSKGIYVLQFDPAGKKLTELQSVSEGKDPSFLTIHPNGKILYAVYSEGTNEKKGKGSVMSFKIDQATGLLSKLNEQSSEGENPVHVSVDPKGRFVYVANYGSGTLAVYPVNKDGSLGKATEIIQNEGSGPNPDRQKTPHVHSVNPSKDGKFIYVSDLGIDKILIYKVGKTGKLSPVTPPYAACVAGSGPRYLGFHPNGHFAFSTEELSSKLSIYGVNKNNGSLTPLNRMNTVPDDFKQKNTPAEAHLSNDGNFLYVSNRGNQSLAIYAVNAKTGGLAIVGYENIHGARPRNFYIDQNDDYIFVANQDSDNVVIFQRDKKTGKLTFTGIEAKILNPVCVQQLLL